ncbi:Protein transport protein [Trichinella spiralis]|uniref:Protein transport protein n=1 Tax=Trichinella spiralis TaxID=6334 RepID=A0ABR3KWA7_TRISP
MMTGIHLRTKTMISRGRGFANPLPTIDHFLRTVGDGRRWRCILTCPPAKITRQCLTIATHAENRPDRWLAISLGSTSLFAQSGIH